MVRLEGQGHIFMTHAPPEPIHLGPPERQIFAILHQTPRPPRASLLICPPFLHEHTYSYRLFSMLARNLAMRDIAVLRFDYHGTGDSAGEDYDFLPTGACADARVAFQHLLATFGSAPIFIMGVRASSIVAIETAATVDAAGLFLWQPIAAWTDYLAEIEALDAQERADMPHGPAYSRDTLMGYRLSSEFRELPSNLRVQPDASWNDRTAVIGDDAAAARLRALAIPVPPILTRWTTSLEIGSFPSAQVSKLATDLRAAMISD
jgi:alpha/beta superfamily hydrolase